MSKELKYYCEEPLKITLESIKENAKNNKYSCAHRPLLNISLDHVVPDELHLMLRVTGMNIDAYNKLC
jgi:hypothetical protein